jgi:type IV pilus assembly protein PilF
MQIGMRILSQIIISLMLLWTLVACTSTSSTTVTPYTADTVTKVQEVNKQKAAATRLTLGLRYLSQGDFEKGKFNLDKAYAHDPDNEDVHRGLAWYYEQVDEEELAREHYQKALRINGKNPDLLNQYGVFLCRHNKLEDSIEMFLASADIPTNKDVSSAYENAATCSLTAGDVKTAEQYYRRALNHNPEKADSLLGMASIEYDRGRLERAMSYLTRYQKVGRNSPRYLWLALRTNSKLGNMDEVASLGIKLEQMFPDSDETAVYLDSRSSWLR